MTYFSITHFSSYAGDLDHVAALLKEIFPGIYVKNVEITHIYGQPVLANEKPNEPIDLQPIISDGLLSVVDLENEQEAINVLYMRTFN